MQWLTGESNFHPWLRVVHRRGTKLTSSFAHDIIVNSRLAGIALGTNTIFLVVFETPTKHNGCDTAATPILSYALVEKMETSSLFTKVASSSDFNNSIEVAMKELSKKDGRSKLIYHGHTCRAVSELNKVWFVPRGGPQTALLHALGPGAALEVIGVNLSSSR